jgi:hypothetical protein
MLDPLFAVSSEPASITSEGVILLHVMWYRSRF